MPEGGEQEREPVHSVSGDRVRAALCGQLNLTALSQREGALFNAAIAAAVPESLGATHYGDLLAARGVTTVAMDDDGHLIERRLGGS